MATTTIDKKDDMLFAVAYVDAKGEILDIKDGPYSRVGTARGMLTRARNRFPYRRKNGADYKLMVTSIDWHILDE